MKPKFEQDRFSKQFDQKRLPLADANLVTQYPSDYRCIENGITLQEFWYAYPADSHTSLVGARGASRTAARCFGSDEEVGN